MIPKHFKKNVIKKHRIYSFLIAALCVVVLTVLVSAFANALTDSTRPTIIQVSPANNQLDVSTHEVVMVQFSELMDASTINKNTFMVVQRTTPEPGSPSFAYRSRPIEGTISYNGLVATFTPTNQNKETGLYSNPLQPSQEFGNVFTVTITSEVRDLAGNSLSRNYLWSFSTGSIPFNTDATTSQLDQTPIPVIEPAVIPVPAPPVAAAPETTASSFPMAWLIGALIILALIILISALAVRSSRQKKSHHVQATHSNPFGDVHPVIDIKGIGPEYNGSLLAMGIKNTKQLWEADAATVARETGAPLSLVQSWQHMAELATVKDIGPQYAELLERSGVHSIGELKNYSPHALLKRVRDKQYSLKVRIQGNFPGYAMAKHWIQEARHHKFSTV